MLTVPLQNLPAVVSLLREYDVSLRRDDDTGEFNVQGNSPLDSDQYAHLRGAFKLLTGLTLPPPEEVKVPAAPRKLSKADLDALDQRASLHDAGTAKLRDAIAKAPESAEFRAELERLAGEVVGEHGPDAIIGELGDLDRLGDDGSPSQLEGGPGK